ncbi:MAG: adenylosuccinate synthetase [Patescibacteria group bacterium]
MNSERHAILVAGLAFGDEGKGKIVDHLTRTNDVHTIVRYNGSSQAAHNVVTDDGRHHTFAQIGSGSFVPGVRTHLSRFMLVNPVAFLPEAQHLVGLGVTDIFSRVTVDRDALVTTPFQIAMNRLRELSRGKDRHGSCGLGVYETFKDNLDHGDAMMFVRDLENPTVMERKLRFIQELKLAQAMKLPGISAEDPYARKLLDILSDPWEIGHCADWFNRFIRGVTPVDGNYLTEILAREGTTVFEGAQGVLLDECGFFPYSTPTKITFANAERLLAESHFRGDTTRLGVMRSYFTRHGAGPLVTEADLGNGFDEPHNRPDAWQQDFRLGHLDLVALRYSLEVLGGVDEIALTHLDRIGGSNLECTSYTAPTAPDASLFDAEGRKITAIKSETEPDLERQERVTRTVQTVRPVLKPLPADAGSFIEHLENELGTPITVCSTGPSTGAAFERPKSRKEAA